MTSPESPKFEPKKDLKALILSDNKKTPEAQALSTPESLVKLAESRNALRDFVNSPGDKIERYDALRAATKQISKELRMSEETVWGILFPEYLKIERAGAINFDDKSIPLVVVNYFLEKENMFYRVRMGIYKENYTDNPLEMDPLLLRTLKKITKDFEKENDVDFLKYCKKFMGIPFIRETAEHIIKKERDPVRRGRITTNIDVFKNEPYAEEVLMQCASEEYNAEIILRNIDSFKDMPYARKIIAKAVDTVNKHPETMIDYTRFLRNEPYALEFIKNSAYKNIAMRNPEIVLNEIIWLKDVEVMDITDMATLSKWAIADEIIEKALDALSKIRPEMLMAYIGYWGKSSRKKEYIKTGIEAMLAKSEDVIVHYPHFKDEPYASPLLEKVLKTSPQDILTHAQDLIHVNSPLPLDLIHRAIAECMTKHPMEATIYLQSMIELFTKNNKAPEKVKEWKKQAFQAAKEVAKANPRNIVHTIDLKIYEPAQRAELVEIAALAGPWIFQSDLSREIIEGLEISLSPISQKIQKICDLVDKKTIDRHVLLLTQLIIRDGMTIEEANSIAQNPGALFKEVMQLSTTPNVIGKNDIEDWLSQESMKHVRVMNDLHESKDEVRFANIKNSTPDEIYSHMVYGEAEVFTSTFNGMYTRMMEKAKAESKTGYHLMEGVNFTHFRTFIKLCARYNRLREFLGTMAADKQKEVVDRFIAGIESEKNSLEEAVTIADTFASIRDPELLKIIQEKIRSEYARVQGKDNKEGKKVYGLLAGMFGGKAAIDQGWYKEMGEKYKLDDITHIDSKELYDARQINTQQYFFYDDSDGKGSYESFINTYQGKPKWKIEDKKTYVVITGTEGGRHIEMYANKPDHEDAAKEIEKVLEEKKIEKIVVVHRGHSYHAQATINQLTDRAKIVVLGSCGGYTNVVGVLEKSPQAHILATKGTGTMTVNDPILMMLNEEILAGKNIDWQVFWDRAEKKLGANPNFGSYVPPHRNLGIAFLKAYRTLTE